MAVASADSYDNSIGNLMVVLRETEGAVKTDEVLKSSGPAKATMADGKEVEFFSSLVRLHWGHAHSFCL